MNKHATIHSEALTRQIRGFRHRGLQVTLRAGKLRIQDPSGTVFVESAQDSDRPVELFLSHALQRYAFSVLASDCPVIATGSQEATWTIGDIMLRAQACWAFNFGVELTATTADGVATTREIWDSNRWPEPEELATLRDCLIEDARLLSRLRAYTPSARFARWLFTIATNLARNHVRWKERHPEVTLESKEGETSPLDHLADETPCASEQRETKERAKAVRTAVTALAPDLRTAILLFEYEGLSHAEIATVQGCTAKAVETRLYRARQYLEQKLAPWLKKS